MEVSQYLALLGLWIAGIVAPGPDVLVILRNASLGACSDTASATSLSSPRRSILGTLPAVERVTRVLARP